MKRGWRDEPGVRGGCRCAAVRGAIAAGPMNSVTCHCRMCRRATGNGFAPTLEAAPDQFAWIGEPAEWASSDRATRGFCPACGTPLCYRSGDTTGVMAGMIGPGSDLRACGQIAVESRRRWVGHLTGLPEIPTPAAWAVISRQSPE